MKNIKYNSVLGTNSNEIKASILILETNKKEGEEFLFYSYKSNNSASELEKLKGVILAGIGIANGVIGEDYEIMIVEDIEEKKKIYKSNFLKTCENYFFFKNNFNNVISFTSKYKVCSRCYLKKFLISVILPASVPDNCIKYVCNELIESISTFFLNFESEEIKSLYTQVIYKFCDYLVFSVLTYLIQIYKEDINYSNIIYSNICNSTFSYNDNYPIFLIKPPLSDILKSDIIDICNSINSDRSIIQENLTLMDPPFFIKGIVLSFNNYIIYNSLSNYEFENIYRVGTLFEVYRRNCSSGKVLICENIHINNNIYYNNNYEFSDDELSILIDTSKSQTELNKNSNEFINLNNKLNNEIVNKLNIPNNILKTSIIVTILAQRSFVLYIYLDVLNSKINSSFDPFYHKRAENLLINLLKKSYEKKLNNELKATSISSIENNKLLNKEQGKYITTGLFDINSKVNIIHYSVYNDTERVINTSDIYIDSNTLHKVYKHIYIQYAKIKSNANKLQQRRKNIMVKQSLSYKGITRQYCSTLKLEASTKARIIKDNFLNYMSCLKIQEYATKLHINNKNSSTPIWICCKVYEHFNQSIDALEEYYNYKIIFVAYESKHLVDIDNFCQDLLINENFN